MPETEREVEVLQRSDSEHQTAEAPASLEAEGETVRDSSVKRDANASAGTAAVKRIAGSAGAPSSTKHPAGGGTTGGTGGTGGTGPAGKDPAAQVKTVLKHGVTAASAQQALHLITSSSDAGAVVDALGAPLRLQIATQLQASSKQLSHEERASIKPIFDRTANGEVQTLENLLGARFAIINVGADKKKGVAWEPGGLRQAWGVLEALPAANVEGNDSLLSLVRYKVATGNQGEGYYSPDNKVAAIGYDPKTIDQADHDFSEKTDPLYGANAFNETVRHEIGHAVDQMLSASDKYCIGNAGGGNWKEHGEPSTALVTEIINAAGGTIAHWADPAQKNEIVALLNTQMGGGALSTIETALPTLSFWSKLDAKKQQDLINDKTVQTLKANNVAEQPWMSGASPGIDVGGRIFEESYDKSWNSYASEARARKVSLYQFRAPGEWFAEAYAAYYEPAAPGQAKGATLNGRDPNTKTWFDKNIDTVNTPANPKNTSPAAAGSTGGRKA